MIIRDSGIKALLTLGIFYASGAAGLIYEILWMRQLTQLFGSTSQSAAVTTAAFFSGLAAGSWFWGRRSSQWRNPLNNYALLEFGIVLAGLFYFLLFQVYFLLYGYMFDTLAETALWFPLFKGLLAVVLICPASFLMGGTLPVMGAHLIRESRMLGRLASTLYAINTLGAVTGAVAAGFFLPRLLGINLTYALALLLSLTLGVSAWLLARTVPARTETTQRPHKSIKEHGLGMVQLLLVSPLRAMFQTGKNFGFLEFVALLSGFLSLAMQVLWIRMFVQVLQNSTYTFSAVLVVFLAALALGALLVRGLSKYLSASNNHILMCLLAVSGIACMTSPMLFVTWTDGLTYLGNQDQLGSYLLQVFFASGVIVGLPTTLLGMVLPFLFRHAENLDEAPGSILGRLGAWNTAGAVIGPLVASFLLLPMLGLWNSVLIIGAAYLAIPIVCFADMRARLVTVSVFALTLLFANPVSLPLVRINTGSEQLLALWEGPDGTVAVVEREGSRRIKLNNWYALGGSGALRMEQIQTHLPMHLHPDPRSIFYLGMGTGITAGTVLNYPVEQVTVAELSAEVINASARYFSEYTNQLHNHPAVRVVPEDGRNYLAGTQQQYDLIIADLFIPWRAGVALLYTLEHFERARQRLKPDGLFVQWIPLYQISERELKIIANTMAQAFPVLSLWRGDFYAEQPILALVGHKENEPLPRDLPIIERSRHDLASFRRGEEAQIPLLSHYLGTLTRDHEWVQDAQVNTDNKPVIEYLAPESHRAERAGVIEWFTGEQMISFMQLLQQFNEPATDPYLDELENDLRQAAYAGLFFHLAAVAENAENEETRQQALQLGRELLGGGV
ncbi:MAG: fused MFS/spermidine synthase [Gammaproteobacteria bacterium]|nr:fused MFS/spermidine synthase [Gammaproteobacteria bacterium]